MKSPTHPVLAPHRIAAFMPGRLNDDEIRASFIARQSTLTLILEDIASTRDNGIPQHHLIIGQRGMGKTSLLRRLDLALREAPLNQQFIPLSFPEEQWAIDRLSALWLNCLDSLADTLEKENQSSALIDKIDDAVEGVRQDTSPETLVAQSAERVFIALAKEIGRLPVLLIDNLDLVFSRLNNSELSALRSFLMKAGAPILIGASVYPPDQTQDYQAPFYDHFKTHHLSRLSLEEMQEVMVQLAEHTGNKDIPARLQKETGRVRALHTLTGGNPRTTVILFQIFSRGFSQEAYEDLEALLDWITPLYKARFEELSDQAQVIVSALALHWEPATSAVLGERTRLKNSQISSNLDRLKKAGIVEETTIDRSDRSGPLPKGPSPKDRKGFQIAERFFNIWFLMRQATRRDKRNLAFLTRFIECVHSNDERDRMAKDLIDKSELSRSEQIFGLALESSIERTSLRADLRDHIHQDLIEAKRIRQQQIEEIIDPSEIPDHHWEFAELRDKIKRAKPKKIDLTPSAYADQILGSVSLISARHVFASKRVGIRRVKLLLEASQTIDEINRDTFGPTTVEWMRSLLIHGSMCDFTDPIQVGDLLLRSETEEQVRLGVAFAKRNALAQLPKEAWEAARLKLEPEPESVDHESWFRWGRLLHFDFSQFAMAEKPYRKAIALNPDSHSTWNSLGLLLLEKLNRVAESQEAFERAIELSPETSDYWYNLGLFQDASELLEQAEHSFRKAIDLDPKFSRPHIALGNLLFDKLKRRDEAETEFRTTTDIAPENAIAWNNLGVVLKEKEGGVPEAEKCFRRSLELDEGVSLTWRNYGNLLNFQLNREKEAIDAYRRSVQIDSDAYTWNQLGWLLAKEKDGYKEAETAFKKAIKADSNFAAPWRNLGHLLRKQSDRTIEVEPAYRTAIKIDPSSAGTWNTLGNFLLDDLARPRDALTAFEQSIKLDPEDSLAPKCNSVFVLRDHLDQPDKGRELLTEIEVSSPSKCLDGMALQHALFAAHDDNWGTTMKHFTDAFEKLSDEIAFPENTEDDWMRTSAVILHLGFGEKFLEFLEERGETQRRRPWFEAIRAHVRGDRRYLRNIPVELRDISGQLFNEIEKRFPKRTTAPTSE